MKTINSNLYKLFQHISVFKYPVVYSFKGPLTYNDAGQAILVGVVSRGYGCGDVDYPGVYARVTEVLPWIEEELAKTCGDDVTTIRPVNNASCYYLSDIEEKYCDFNPVRTASECHEAAKFLNATIVPQGCERMPESCELQGCVSDKKTDPGTHLVFWNGEHNADQNSSDPKIRRICRGKEETPEKRKLNCNKSFLICNQNNCLEYFMLYLCTFLDIQP